MKNADNLPLHELSLGALVAPEGFECACGRRHCALPLRRVIIEPGAIEKLPDAVSELGVRRVLLVTGEHSERVAGRHVAESLTLRGFDVHHISLHGAPKVLPNEEYAAVLDASCAADTELILGVGSGVINDLCKLTSASRGIPCAIAATAPSMDGYASDSSAMELSGIKTTIYTTCPSLIVCDTEIMRHAPMEMITAGFGDMAAKLISVADWKIAHLITGEYYCDEIAALMSRAYSAVLSSAPGLRARKSEAVSTLTEGLVLSGIASAFAGVSRPASGTEHTFSHLLEMFALARGAQGSLHGLQVGCGVRETLKLYERAYDFTPSEKTCRAASGGFDEQRWRRDMRAVFGAQADELIRRAEDERRNAPENIYARGMAAVNNWGAIRAVIAEVLNERPRLESALDSLNVPSVENIAELGFTPDEAHLALAHSKDLRSRYIFTGMCADIGLTSVI